MTRTDSAIIEALDAGAGGKPTRFRIRVIKAGLSGNGVLYPDAVLRAAVPLFAGARVFAKSDADHLAGRGKDVRNLVGRLVDPAFVAGATPDGGEVQATLDVLDSAGDMAARMREALARGMASLFGFSIDAVGATRPGTVAGKTVRIVDRFTNIKSVDLIVEPGAGGGLINLIEAAPMTKKTPLTAEAIELAIVKSGLPEAAREHLTARYATRADLEETELREAIDAEKTYLARLTESGTIQGLGGDGDDTRANAYGHTRVVEAQSDKYVKRLDAFFQGKDRSASSIRDIYIEGTGDRGFTGRYADCDQRRLRESLSSVSWTDLLGDSITRRMIADYNVPNVYDVWRQLATIVPVRDFRTQERARFGGYGDLPIVNEGQPYIGLDSPTDEKATYAIAKRGGTEDLTIEMIANDDVGSVRAIPRKLARSAKRTISKFVLDFIVDNPTIYDSLALFHATHGNLGTAALDGTALSAARVAVFKQTEKDSGDRVGVNVRNLWVPVDLEEDAVDLFRRNTNNDKNFLQSLTLNVMPVWYWTDTNDWALSADPMEAPSVEVGFFQGIEEPELFIQDQPVAGAMFSHDRVTYKIRHIYGAVVTDYRGLYKAVVA